MTLPDESARRPWKFMVLGMAALAELEKNAKQTSKRLIVDTIKGTANRGILPLEECFIFPFCLSVQPFCFSKVSRIIPLRQIKY